MKNIYVDLEEITECSSDFAGTAQTLREIIKKLKSSAESSGSKKREMTEELIKKLEKKADELECLSVNIKKAADEYLQNEEDTAVIIRKKLFLNTDKILGSSFIIERDAKPSESAVLFSHLLDHSPMMEEMMIKDAQRKPELK